MINNDKKLLHQKINIIIDKINDISKDFTHVYYNGYCFNIINSNLHIFYKYKFYTDNYYHNNISLLKNCYLNAWERLNILLYLQEIIIYIRNVKFK